MNRAKWTAKQKAWNYVCPTCQLGHYRPVDEAFKDAEDGSSILTKLVDESFDPEWTTWKFTELLRCDNADCQQAATAGGNRSVDINQVDWDVYIETYYNEIKFIYPAPIPITLDPSYPESVASHIRAASELYWISPDAAANQIRQAVEQLLTDRNVATEVERADGSTRAINLHARIALYAEQDKDNADLLFALKWLGNAGSHPGGIDSSDVLDGFEMLHHVLDAIYIDNRGRLLARAQQINEQKGPRTPVPRPRPSVERED